jgi:hypothetical protein
MKNLNRIYLAFTLIVISVTSCKKEAQQPEPVSVPVPEAKAITRDSISFSIDGKFYAFNEKYSRGLGNQPVDIKPSATILTGRKLAYQTGNLYWYGEPDSTLFTAISKFKSASNVGHLELIFARKFKDAQLQKSGILYLPGRNEDVFKVGKMPFAVDLEKENTMEGIALSLFNTPNSKALSTCKPGFSILLQAGLKNDIQNNSTFEITSIKNIQEGYVQVEGKFELNLFDEDAKQYRVKNGFIRFTGGVSRNLF